MPPAVGAIASWLGLVAIVIAAVTFSSGTKFPGFAAVLPVAGAVLVLAGGAARPDAGAALLLDRRPLQFVGRISYSLYLVHWPILLLAAAAAGPYVDLALWQTAALAALSIPVAWLLHRAVEEPGRGARMLVRARPRVTLLAVGASTVVVVAVAVAALVATSMQPLDGGRVVAATAPTAPPSSPAVVPSNLEPSLRTAVDDNALLYSDGCQVGYTPSIPHPCWFGSGAQRIVLFGDSHAAQWFPALEGVATSGGFRLETQTKSACPSADVELLWGGRPYVRCDRWRAAVIDQLRADPPDLVVLANYSDPEYADRTDRSRQWEQGLQSTIAQLSAFTKVAVIAGTPDLRHDPVVCLSAHLTSPEECSLPAEVALDAPGPGRRRRGHGRHRCRADRSHRLLLHPGMPGDHREHARVPGLAPSDRDVLGPARGGARCPDHAVAGLLAGRLPRARAGASADVDDRASRGGHHRLGDELLLTEAAALVGHRVPAVAVRDIGLGRTRPDVGGGGALGGPAPRHPSRRRNRPGCR